MSARPRSRLGAQDGMTLVEVLMALFVLCVGLLGYMTTLSTSRAAINAGERSAAMTQIGEQTLQSVESLPYASVADSAAPTKTTTTDKTNPTYYLVTGAVAGSSCNTATSCYQWDPTSTTSAELLAIDAVNGKVAPGPTTVVAPGPTGTCTTINTTSCQLTIAVYRFVTDATDSVCSQTGVSCASTISYKRVTVAVKNTGVGAPHSPLYFSSIVANNAGGINDPLSATGATGATTTCLDGTTSVPCIH